ncbi:MAG: hypothetical protein ACRYFZ_23470 [Janthinobacterium lividum]
MVTPNPAPDSGRPSDIEDAKLPSTGGAITNPDADQDPNASGNPETVTQSDLASSDGAGIRGDYGDASQTTGLEGGEQSPTDAGPDRAGDNPTNAAQ